MSEERIEPLLVADERTMLEAWLEWHRGTLATKVRRPNRTSCANGCAAFPLSLLGLVRHMAEVESGWFRRCLAGEDVKPLYCSNEDPDADFTGVDEADPTSGHGRWRERMRARAIRPRGDRVARREGQKAAIRSSRFVGCSST